MRTNSVIAYRFLAMVGAFAITLGLLAGSFATAPQARIAAEVLA